MWFCQILSGGCAEEFKAWDPRFHPQWSWFCPALPPEGGQQVGGHPAPSLCRERAGWGLGPHWTVGVWGPSSWWCSASQGPFCPSLESDLGWGNWREEEEKKGAAKLVRRFLPYCWQEMVRSEMVESWRSGEAWCVLKATVPDWWYRVRKAWSWNYLGIFRLE